MPPILGPADTLRYADSLLMAAHRAGAQQRSEILAVLAVLAVLVILLVVLVVVLIERQRRIDLRTQKLVASLVERAKKSQAAELQAVEREAVASEAAERERAKADRASERVDRLLRITRVDPSEILSRKPEP